MNVVELHKPGVDDMLTVVDSLRAKVASGEIKAFVAVGIYADDGCAAWIGNAGKSKTLLQLLGSVEHLKQCLYNGDFDSK